MSFILGLDLGTNSIGWICLDKKNRNILGMGSRIFPEGVGRDTKGKEVSKNTKRRESRQTRRRLGRITQRKNRLREILRSANMFPKTEKEFNRFFRNEGNSAEGNIAGNNVYFLRKRGLDEKLSPMEYGRVLYHLAQRRGFKSTRKAEKEKDDGVVKEQTTQLQKEIDESGSRTLGEFFSNLNPEETRIRGRYTQRKMYEQEFDALWKIQKQFHPQLNEELIKKIRNEIIFFQRPLKSQAKLIGFCSLEPKKRRCAKEILVAQKYRILETVNRLSFTDDDGVIHDFCRNQNEEFPDQIVQWRNNLIEELWKQKERTYKQIKKLLNIPDSCIFNLEKGGESKIKGNTTGHAFSLVFGKAWHSKSPEEQEKIHQVVRGADDPEWLKNYAMENWGLSEEKALKLANKTSFQSGYMHYSSKALNRLIPFLEQGLNLSEAKDTAGYTEKQKQESPVKLIKNLRNPIVQQTLYELKHLLKIIKHTYGEPDKVIVELARELKSSAKKREQTHFENLDRRNQHEDIRERLIEKGISPTHNSILQYKLWQECGNICPYTGLPISQEALFGKTPEFQIEHILPKSRSLDDSFMNLTLCHVDENKRKKNNIPYEIYKDTAAYNDILARLKKNISENGMPYNKLRKFLQKEINNDFISRQLNDTAYISRQSKKLMEAMGFKVQISKGQATAELRHLWGLNSLISGSSTKNRGDHRHHAIDAAVVAMTDTQILKNLSSINKYGQVYTEKRFPPPWPNFRDSLKPHLVNMLVSYRVNKRARGALHDEFRFGISNRKSEKGGAFFVIRKKLEVLTSTSVKQIVDPTVKEIVFDRLKEQGINPEAKTFKIPAKVFHEPLYMKSHKGKKIPIKKVRIEEIKNNAIVLPNGFTAVEPGGNHHIVLYNYLDKKGETKQGGEICTLFEAQRRKRKGEAIIKRDLGSEKEFLMSLAINEMVLLDIEEKDIDWRNLDYTSLGRKLHYVQKLTIRNKNPYIYFRFHLDASKSADPISKTAGSFKGIKVRVDRIGRIHKAHD